MEVDRIRSCRVRPAATCGTASSRVRAIGFPTAAAMTALEAATTPLTQPALPPGRSIDLLGRGRSFIREAGDPAAPPVILLHGWCANADVAWWPAFEALAAHHRVIALDHRGHSRGIKDGRAFTLTDCADDVAALAATLGLGRFTAIGYSMGGAIAQLTWLRHRQLVDGLVLCATSRSFSGRPKERGMQSLLDALGPTTRAMPAALRAGLANRALARRRTDQELPAWAAPSLRAHDWLRIVEAGQEILRFDSREWASEIDVPTAVVMTTTDTVVPHGRQLGLAAAIRGATSHELPGGHTACATSPDPFADVLLDACASVAARRALVV